MTIDGKHMGLSAGQVDGRVWAKKKETPALTDDALRQQAKECYQMMGEPDLKEDEFVAGYIEGYRQEDGTNAPRDDVPQVPPGS